MEIHRKIRQKTLYVCRHNIARSQWAAGFHNRFRPGEAISAGTHVDDPGGLVEDWQDPNKLKFIWLAIAGGIEIARNSRTQLSDEALEGVGRMVLIDLEAYKEMRPRLGAASTAPAIEVWEDVDDPHHMGWNEAAATRDLVKQHVGELIASTSYQSVLVERQ